MGITTCHARARPRPRPCLLSRAGSTVLPARVYKFTVQPHISDGSTGSRGLRVAPSRPGRPTSQAVTVPWALGPGIAISERAPLGPGACARLRPAPRWQVEPPLRACRGPCVLPPSLLPAPTVAECPRPGAGIQSPSGRGWGVGAEVVGGWVGGGGRRVGRRCGWRIGGGREGGGVCWGQEGGELGLWGGTGQWEAGRW